MVEKFKYNFLLLFESNHFLLLHQDVAVSKGHGGGQDPLRPRHRGYQLLPGQEGQHPL